MESEEMAIAKLRLHGNTKINENHVLIYKKTIQLLHAIIVDLDFLFVESENCFHCFNDCRQPWSQTRKVRDVRDFLRKSLGDHAFQTSHKCRQCPFIEI